MRKKKEQIVSLLQCYKEAHSTIRKGIEEGRGEEAISLLVLCQEGMEKIEQDTEEEPCGKTEREALFSSYQEALYSCYLSLIKTEEEEREENLDSPALDSQQVSCAKRAISHLDRAEAYFSKIEEEIASIPFKTLHLFLPYKASMWDSMESVYFAALQDPSCEALVMPITYYEKEDGKFGKRINERAEFPREIETIDEGFSLEEAQPDVIYIHNPYDGFNPVWSVDPFFYSDKLKQYTNNLVYIPDFVTDEIDPQAEEDGKAFYNMRYYVTVPGIFHADYTIVQSERMRKAYLEKISRFLEGKEDLEERAGNTNRIQKEEALLTRKEVLEQMEKKILGAGSCLLGEKEGQGTKEVVEVLKQILFEKE